MQMTNHIQDLLYRYECVVIPEFGAFLTQRKSARFDREAQKFYPPQKKISFNRQLQSNDGLLANYVAEMEEISYEQSLKKIYDFVENLIDTLEMHHKVQIGAVGLFYTQADKILFQPSLQRNFLLEAYGTSSLQPTEIDRVRLEEKEQEGIKEAPKKTAIQALYTQKSNKSVILRYAAVGVVAIGLGGFLTANWYSNQIRSHNLAAQQQAESTIENKIQQATFTIKDPLPAVKFNVVAKRGKYHIVAGAFRKEKNAKKMLEELRGSDQNFHPKYIGGNKYGLYQVIYDSYEDRNEALKTLYKIKNNGNSEAWLLVKDL